MAKAPMLVFEGKADYIDHDRLFKELIKTFFQQFIAAFLPEEYPFINFSSVKFMEQEVFTDIIKGEKRQIDILAEVSLKGENQIILIHIEPQSSYQKEFHERMFIYYSRLYEKYRKPILPIAVFSYNDRKEVPNQFTIELTTYSVLKFRYLQLHLIKKNWREFIHNDNPVVAALLSKMGYTKQERVQVRVEFLKMVSRLELNPAEMELLYGFFDTYLTLNDKEEIQMREKIAQLPKEEADRVMELPNYYYDKGKEEGFEKGVEKGIERVVQNMIKNGFSNEIICDITGLNMEKVAEMRRRKSDSK